MFGEKLQKLGQQAAENKKQKDVSVAFRNQTDSALIWKSAAMHPLQVLQNIHHRTVREALRPLGTDDDKKREETEKQLGAFCYHDSAAPQLLPPPDSLDSEPAFLEERLEDCAKRLRELAHAARKLKAAGAQLDPVIVASARSKIDAELKVLDEIMKAVPGNSAGVNKLRGDLQAQVAKIPSANESDFARIAAEAGDLAEEFNDILQGGCCITNLHDIDTFYLWRLLVKYRLSSNKKLTNDIKSNISGEATSLLHKGCPYIAAWLTQKLADLNAKLMALDSAHLFFYLKGGRALQYMMGTPNMGENDFDTGIIINPNLPAGQWYRLFGKVHNLCLRHLRRCKYEFIGLMENNAAVFAGYVDGLSKQPASTDEDADLMAEINPPLEGANTKAELIDIGVPHRDTSEIWETWRLKPDAITHGNGMVFPGPLYYVNEYVMMIREAFQPGSKAGKKIAKRLKRLAILLGSDKTNAAVNREVKHIPDYLLDQAIKATNTFGSSAKAVKTVLAQLAAAHLMREDSGLCNVFDPYFAAQCGKKQAVVKYPEDFRKAIDALDPNDKDTAAQRQTAEACGFVHAIAGELEQHLRDRGEFFRQNRKEFSRFIKAIYTASIFGNQAEDLELMFCVAGSFAARLHAEYAGYEHLEDIEPLHRIDLKIFCKANANPDIVAEIIAPGIIEAYKAHPDTPEYVIVPSHSGSLNVYWPSEETMGQFTYRPLVIRLSIEKRPADWPQLAFIWGYPVLGLRDLLWDYIKECGHTEEFSARQRLSKTADALTDILTKFENPDAEPVAATQAMAANAAAAGAAAAPLISRTVTGLVEIAQGKPNWCWAAVSEMMRRLYANDGTTQQQIVQGLYGNDNDQQGPLVLPGVHHRNAGQGVVLSWDDFKSQIDRDKPFVFATGQHYMVARGYEEQGEERRVLYWDPLPTGRGSRRTMTYQAYCTTVHAGGATYCDFFGPNRP